MVLRAKSEDNFTVRKLVSYILELARIDMKYDVRDRARTLSKILSTFLGADDKEENSRIERTAHLIAEKLFGSPIGSPLSEPISSRFYLPGSLSQIVLHAAPGYEPLPKPCSLLLDDVHQASDILQETEKSKDSFVTDDSETASSSLDEQSVSDYSSHHTDSQSSISDGSEESESLNEADKNANPLIEISDADNNIKGQNGAETNRNPPGSDGVEEVYSRRALESWLGEEPALSEVKLSGSDAIERSARISIEDVGSRVKPKSCTLLDTVNGQGLKVDYSFSSQVSDISPFLVCVEITFHNCSNEPFSEVMLVDEGANRGPDMTEQVSITAERYWWNRFEFLVLFLVLVMIQQ